MVHCLLQKTKQIHQMCELFLGSPASFFLMLVSDKLRTLLLQSGVRWRVLFYATPLTLIVICKINNKKHKHRTKKYTQPKNNDSGKNPNIFSK